MPNHIHGIMAIITGNDNGMNIGDNIGIGNVNVNADTDIDTVETGLKPVSTNIINNQQNWEKDDDYITEVVQ